MELSLLLGALVGTILGLTGAGGGILAVPALVAGMGWSMQQSAPVALVAVAGSAALGALEGLRKGLVRYKAAIVMVLAGLPLTSLGVSVAHALSQRWLQGLFAGVMLIAAGRLLRQSRGSTLQCEGQALAQLNPATGRFEWNWHLVFLFGMIGALTGFMTGLLGVGGGFVIVPVLRRFTNLTMHGIVATSLMVIALVSSGGIVSAVAHGAQLPLEITTFFALATTLGMIAGRVLSAHFSQVLVQRTFAVVLLFVAARLLLAAVTGV